MSGDLSLSPKGGRHGGGSLSRSAIKLLLVCGAVLVMVFVARWHFNSSLNSAEVSLSEAQVAQQQLLLRSQRIKKQLGELQTAGGASQVDLVRGLARSRVDWKAVVLSVARSSSPGLKISSLTATSPIQAADAGSSPVISAADVQISGSAASREQLQVFVKQLRKQTKVFVDIQLKKASSVESGAVDAKGKPLPDTGAVDWDMALTLAPLPPPPTNPPPTGGA